MTRKASQKRKGRTLFFRRLFQEFYFFIEHHLGSSSPTMDPEIAANEAELVEVNNSIQGVEDKIKELNGKMKRLEERIKKVEDINEMDRTDGQKQDLTSWRKEKEQLGEEKNQLREEKNQLRVKGNKFLDEKKSLIVRRDNLEAQEKAGLFPFSFFFLLRVLGHFISISVPTLKKQKSTIGFEDVETLLGYLDNLFRDSQNRVFHLFLSF